MMLSVTIINQIRLNGSVWTSSDRVKNRQQCGYSDLNMNWVVICLLLGWVRGQCNQTDPLLGCTNCLAGTYLVLNVSSSTYTCSPIADCLTVDSGGLCISCSSLRTLNTSGTTDCSSSLSGCKYIKGDVCLQCYPTDYYMLNGECVLNVMEYCWQASASSCLECSDQNILSQSSCLVGSAYCSNFDYQSWQCLTCPNSSYSLHSSGIFCYLPVSGCLIYQLGSCLQCQEGYYLSSGSCLYSSLLWLEVLPPTYYLTPGSFSNALLWVCLSHSQHFINGSCTDVSSGTAYCIAGNSSACTQCVSDFYLSGGQCQSCSVYSHCLTCDQYNCKQCQPEYYLAVDLNLGSIYSFYNTTTQSAQSQCLPCSILGCFSCRNAFTEDGTGQVLCDSCLFGYKLYNHSCYLCAEGYYLNITTLQCDACLLNCQYCPDSPATCLQCLPGYYYNSTGGSCENLTLFLWAPALAESNTFEVLNKSMPFSSRYIVNDQILLVSSCAGDSNGYTCYCTSSATVTYSSLCYQINVNLTKAVLSANSIFNYANFSLTKELLDKHMRTVLLLSELPQFELGNTAIANSLLSRQQFPNYLQIKANYVRNHPSLMSATALTLASQGFTNQAVFSPSQPTIFAGVGYYFKYTPSTATSDTSSFVTVTGSSASTVVLVFFNQTQSASDITGTVYVFSSLTTSSSVVLKIKKINSLGAGQSYQVNVNNAGQGLSVSSDTDGYLTIANVPTSTSTSQFAVYVTTTASSSAGDLYAAQRIENIIYRDAFVYILVVICLYLIFLPMCALVDCVDSKGSRRRVGREESYQGVISKTETNEEEGSNRQEVLSINYKDFFPIYNIANTQRPRRLLKLCLFIVNLQHSVTFLVLVYFHLNAGSPLAAVLLAIPAYLCCLIMGYISGVVVLNLPGKAKYLINLLTLVYWIIWVVVMGQFWSEEYKPYVYVFVVIFFVLDMILDLLETLLMYFTIKQDTRQVKLFRALAKWLSYRGFYEFNEMARDLAEARE